MRGASAVAGALILAGMACSANAATISFVQTDVWSGGDPVAPIFGTPAPSASTPTFTQNFLGNDLPGGARSPYEDNGAGFALIPYSVLSPGHVADAIPGSDATYNLNGATAFSILWGSPDNYNHLQLYDTTDTLVQITNIALGTDLNGSQLPCFGAGTCTNLHWVWLTFSGETALGKLVLSDNGTAAYEYGLNLPGRQTGETPLPAAVWLLGSVLAGGAGFGRWRKRKAKSVAA